MSNFPQSIFQECWHRLLSLHHMIRNSNLFKIQTPTFHAMNKNSIKTFKSVRLFSVYFIALSQFFLQIIRQVFLYQNDFSFDCIWYKNQSLLTQIHCHRRETGIAQSYLPSVSSSTTFLDCRKTWLHQYRVWAPPQCSPDAETQNVNMITDG